MTSPLRSALRLILVGLASALPAVAHPGHDDGHELVWEASHWLAHPAASLLCVSVLGAFVGLGLAVACRPRRSPPASVRTES
jgi:hypothetical protein